MGMTGRMSRNRSPAGKTFAETPLCSLRRDLEARSRRGGLAMPEEGRLSGQPEKGGIHLQTFGVRDCQVRSAAIRWMREIGHLELPLLWRRRGFLTAVGGLRVRFRAGFLDFTAPLGAAGVMRRRGVLRGRRSAACCRRCWPCRSSPLPCRCQSCG